MVRIDLEATGRNLRRLRKAKGYRQDIYRQFGISPPVVSNWECGRNMPCIDNLVLIADFYGVTIDEILVIKGKEQ